MTSDARPYFRSSPNSRMTLPAKPLRANEGETRLVLIVGHFDGTLCWTELHAAECKRLGLMPAAFI